MNVFVKLAKKQIFLSRCGTFDQYYYLKCLEKCYNALRQSLMALNNWKQAVDGVIPWGSGGIKAAYK